MPPRKRVASEALADDTGTIEARIRRHLASMAASQAAMAASHAAILSLLDQLAAPAASSSSSLVVAPSSRDIFVPDDVVRYIFEFVTGRRRRCAQFGSNGVLTPAVFEYPNSVAPLRLINKQWARIGSEFVRWLVMPPIVNCTPAALVKAFPQTSRLSLRRCILDRKTLSAFAAVMKAFSYRPDSSFYVDIKCCSTFGKLAFDCCGKLVNYATFNECQIMHPYSRSSCNLTLLNRACGDLPVSQFGPDEIMLFASYCTHLQSALSQPMKVRAPADAFSDIPLRPGAFRALVLRIEGINLSYPPMTLDKWLLPDFWYDGRRPMIKLVAGDPAIHDQLIEFARLLAERHQISVLVVTNDGLIL